MDIPFTCHSEAGDIFWIPIVLASILLFVFSYFFAFLIPALLIVELFFLTVMIFSWYYTTYTFELDRLIVKVQLERIEPNIDYSSVKRIVVPGGGSYIHGCSRNTIKIYYGKKECVNISPTNRKEIIEFLCEKCPTAELEGKYFEK